MNENSINEAVESITLIKEVISRTNKSFVGFSKLFIGWGVLFSISAIGNLIIAMNPQKVSEFLFKNPFVGNTLSIVLNIFLSVGVFLIAVLMYNIISKKKPLIGLEKHLAKLWLLLIFSCTLLPKITISSEGAMTGSTFSQAVSINNISAILFSLAIGLIITSLLTDFKQLSYIGYIFISLSLLNQFFELSIFKGVMLYVWHALPVPIALLYTGFFLKSQQARG